ncbi:MAG: alpha-D-ribose 1-methylphosphonate 5-phosphate C-P-lyase PhnJ [Deltaproteobacteria bacterium]|jgi:alpha-D-ribose 1-methylphosphonate 5-phosphate C-P lyase|nr:alpha-D-ribose 1-methylphosphonate 5-phosphate C-P-lyase PhnJ [Deltaproteobacteria bacterium]
MKSIKKMTSQDPAQDFSVAKFQEPPSKNLKIKPQVLRTKASEEDSEAGGNIRQILQRCREESKDKVSEYNFAYLDEDTKREIRRALLKAVAVPGYQVPFAGREMPMPYGWGTGGLQVTASIIGPEDTLKVIDQGSDDTTNAVSIKTFIKSLTGVATTTETSEATIIQTRHRIPETPLTDKQIMVYQVPLPEPMRQLEPSEAETRSFHALFEYGLMYLKLYEDVARHKEIAISYDYPVLVARRYAMSPSPIPRFDNPKLHQSEALHLFGAGRERRVYAIPPHTTVKSFDFDDYPFKVQSWDHCCSICGATDSYLDEVIIDDQGARMFVCSDSDHCQNRLQSQEKESTLITATTAKTA